MKGPCAILLVEDDRNEIELISLALGKINKPHTLTIAQSLSEAKTQATAASAVDVILVDVHLGPDSGLDFVRWCKRELGTGPNLIVFSGSAYPPEQEAAMVSGADAVEVKPMSFKELIATLTRILNEWCPS